MKRTFLARRNALFSSSDISWGLIALIVVGALLFIRLLFPNLFWQMLTPAFRVSDTLADATRSVFAGFSDASALAIENEQLKTDNAALTNENQILAERLSAEDTLTGKGIIAGVTARPPTSPYDTLVVLAGAKSGVMLNMEAFGPGGVPVGFVSSVLPDFSRVTLFSSPRLSVAGWAGERALPVTLVGDGAGAMRASVARSEGIGIGDTVFVAGPGLLPIGTVVRVTSDPGSPADVLHVQSSLNPFSLSWVELRPVGSAFVKTLSWATTTDAFLP